MRWTDWQQIEERERNDEKLGGFTSKNRLMKFKKKKKELKDGRKIEK